MANLADQIKELLSILEVVNPAAAAEIRGQDAPRAQHVAMTYSQTIEKPTRAETRKVSQAQPEGADVFNIELSPNKLIQGIIYSELIGKPVSRRRHRGRP